MSSYEILRPLRHSGSGTLAPGGSIELSEREAAPLRKAGVIRPERAGQSLPKAQPQQTPDEPEGGTQLREPGDDPTGGEPGEQGEGEPVEPDAVHPENEPDSPGSGSGADHDATSGAVSRAAELGVDLAYVEGTGRDGRIQADDVQRYADARSSEEQG